ncbi:hypothetical protein [Streptomyces sp. NPDC054797]
MPEVISARPASEGYDLADLVKDLPAVTEEWKAQANWSMVAHEALAAGEDFDSPEFIEGMREWGFAVTAPARLTVPGGVQESQEPAQDSTQAQRFLLEYENFRVHRTVGDGWPGTRDEIRWVSGGRSDKSPAEPFLSQEFGGDKTALGQTPVFDSLDPRRRVSFNSVADVGLSVSVACWESDTGDGNDNDNDNSIGEHLIRFNNDPLFSIVWSAVSAGAPTVVGLLMDITSLAITTINLIARNDLSSARTLLLDRHALAALSHRGSAQWHFNGDGHHELKVKFNGGSIPFPAGTLEYAVRTGTTWGTPTALPFQSMTALALASYKDHLYALFVRPADAAVMWTRLEGSTWKTPARVGGDHTYHAPAVGVAHGKLFYAVTGMNNSLYWRTFDGTNWSAVNQFSGYVSTQPPSLSPVEFAGNGGRRQWLTHVSDSGQLYLTTHDGSRWSTYYGDNLGWRSEHPVAMAPYDGKLWRIHRAEDTKLYTAWNGGTSQWASQGAHPTWRTTHGPALAPHSDGKLWLFLRGTDGVLYAATHSSGAWSGLHRPSDTRSLPQEQPVRDVPPLTPGPAVRHKPRPASPAREAGTAPYRTPTANGIRRTASPVLTPAECGGTDAGQRQTVQNRAHEAH